MKLHVSKQLNTRIQQKHDFEVNWVKASEAVTPEGEPKPFIPKNGEIIVYDCEVDIAGSVLEAAKTSDGKFPHDREDPIPYTRMKIGDGETAVDQLPFFGGISGTTEITKINQKPTVASTLFYSGNVLTPRWLNYDPSKLYIGGETSGVFVGNYTATFTPKENYSWADGSTDSYDVPWTIQRATSSIKLSDNHVTIGISEATKLVYIETVGDGTLSVDVDDTSVVTASVHNNVITLTKMNNVEERTANVTVTLSRGKNYWETTESFEVLINKIIPGLEELSWSDFRAISENDLGENYFSIGDTKTVVLNGKVGDYAEFTGESYEVFIIGFNHNRDFEGSGIHFCGFKDSNGTQCCLCDSEYDELTVQSGGNGFFTKHDMSWLVQPLRTQVLGATNKNTENSLMSALPQQLRDNIQVMTKYTWDSNSATNVSSSDYLTLPGYIEVLGNITATNPDDLPPEQNYQKQYAYFKEGNSCVFYRNDKINESGKYLTRSGHKEHGSQFGIGIGIYEGSCGIIPILTYMSVGITPIFKI